MRAYLPFVCLLSVRLWMPCIGGNEISSLSATCLWCSCLSRSRWVRPKVRPKDIDVAKARSSQDKPWIQRWAKDGNGPFQGNISCKMWCPCVVCKEISSLYPCTGESLEGLAIPKGRFLVFTECIILYWRSHITKLRAMCLLHGINDNEMIKKKNLIFEN